MVLLWGLGRTICRLSHITSFIKCTLTDLEQVVGLGIPNVYCIATLIMAYYVILLKMLNYICEFILHISKIFPNKSSYEKPTIYYFKSVCMVIDVIKFRSWIYCRTIFQSVSYLLQINHRRRHLLWGI